MRLHLFLHAVLSACADSMATVHTVVARCAQNVS